MIEAVEVYNISHTLPCEMMSIGMVEVQTVDTEKGEAAAVRRENAHERDTQFVHVEVGQIPHLYA